MSEETVRNHKNYLGLGKENLRETKNNTNILLPNAFILITSIELLDWRIGWGYNVWESTAHFDNGGNPISDFRRDFHLENADFTAFKTANSALFTTFDERFRGLVLPVPSGDAAFESATFQTVNYQLNIRFTDGDDFPSRRLVNETYNQTIAENMDIIGFDGQGNPGLIPILHAVSAEKDSEFFAGSNLILPQ